MENDEPLRLLLDADLSSQRLIAILNERHDVVAAGMEPTLRQLDDRLLFQFAQDDRRVTITHNSRDVPDILREWAEAGRSHRGCIVSHVPTNAYGEMARRFDRWFRRLPLQDEWIDLAVSL